MQSKDLSRCALLAALMCLCAWISLPLGQNPITLQTFALFLTLELLGGKYGSLVCLTYLLLGGVGLPVFSGFRGGFGMLLGSTGGYLWGFLLCALAYWLITTLLGARFHILACLVGLLLCYALGTSPNPLIRSTTPGLDTNRKGCLIVDENEMTTRDGVFAGGDAVTGAATVILAMGAGKKGAAAIDAFIKNQ